MFKNAGMIVMMTILISLLAVACKKKIQAASTITPQEAAGELRNDFAVLIDVREQSELAQGMAAPAQWMATSKIDANAPEWIQFLEKHPKEKKIILYCEAGGRAGRIARQLAERGYRTANLGGYKDWVAAGLPTRKP